MVDSFLNESVFMDKHVRSEVRICYSSLFRSIACRCFFVYFIFFQHLVNSFVLSVAKNREFDEEFLRSSDTQSEGTDSQSECSNSQSEFRQEKGKVPEYTSN